MLQERKLKILHRLNPDFIWHLYAKKCKKIFEKSYFILSFDCDTEEDINVAWDVHSRLQDMGITPVYAVPGALLQKGEKVYQRIFETGAEFINHGGREHTHFDTPHNRYASCFFYDQQPFETLKADILQGHKILQDVLGITPDVWRTPHFGTFQHQDHLNFLYELLKENNYKISTSTSPMMAYKNGPLYKKKDIIEVPVTGIFSEPFNIMDTWAYFGAPNRVKMPIDYLKTCTSLSQFASQNPLLINIYGDPSHINNHPEFFQAMKQMSLHISSINYTQLLEVTHDKICTF